MSIQYKVEDPAVSMDFSNYFSSTAKCPLTFSLSGNDKSVVSYMSPSTFRVYTAN